ncbi:MAG: T9SS type A sorting domain-containing protein [Flavobacteriales bacterium]|nr:T9SS type A sorting domain-containing protein [Flavobacteriales bacterium]MCB9167084.1 T9SS type A sorting domain-containing protein [Flavobacteriales bacterium]
MRFASFLALYGLVILPRASAQCPGCNPDLACQVTPAYPTLCPTLPPDATVGSLYEADLTFWLPSSFTDPGTGFNVDFLQMTITGISGVPFGLAVETNDPLGIYYPQQNEYGCARICGTPLGAGTFTITISINALVEYSGIQITVPESFPVTLVVQPGNGGNLSFDFNPTSGCEALDVTFSALIDGGSAPTNYAWDFGNGNTSTDADPPVQTYSQPGIYAISLLTTVGGYVLSEVVLNGVNDNWCGDVEEPDIFGCTGAPDLYFVLTDGNGNNYTSSSGSNSQSQTWTNLNLPLNDPPYSITFYDEDPISQDDDLGTYNIPLNGAGAYPFNVAGGTFGQLTIDLTVQQLFQDTDTVTVFSLPDMTTTYDTLGGLICLGDTNLVNTVWYLDGDTVPNAIGACLQTTGAGVYQAEGTNGYGCTGWSVPVVVCPTITITYSGGVLFMDGGTGTCSWTYEGLPVPGADDPYLFSQGDGDYSVTLSTASGCIVSAGFALSTTAVNEHAAAGPRIHIFPVPNDGRFVVKGAGFVGNVGLYVISLSGQVFSERQITPVRGRVSEAFDLPGAAPGIYFVRITDASGSLGRAFVVR